MWDRPRQVWATLLLGNVLMNAIIVVTPFYVPQFLTGGTGRNIRHLPCVSRRTGETGVCMFAFTCAKANGTHLGTCIDRFYFGSCCKIENEEQEADIFPQDNSIDDGPPSLPRPFVTTHAPIESNDIPEYFSRPKPVVEKKPSGGTTTRTSTPTTTTTTTMKTTQPTTTTSVPSTKTKQPTTQLLSSTTRETTRIPTRRPDSTSIETTTQAVRLSTFQTIQNSSKKVPTTESTLKTSTGIPKSTQKPSSITSVFTSTTAKPSTIKPVKTSTSGSSKPSTQNTIKPPSTVYLSTQTSKPSTKKPIYSSTVQKPIQSTVTKLQSTSHKPVSPTTTKPLLTTTQKVVPVTRFPVRNGTTVTVPIKSSSSPSTKKPLASSSKRPSTGSSSNNTKRPTVTTRKPSSPTKRPTTSGSKPSFGSTLGAKPIVTTGKPLPSSTLKAKPPPTSTTSTTLFSVTSRPSTFTTSQLTSLASNKKPATTTATITRTTTKRPFDQKTTLSARPTTSKPTSKPKPSKVTENTTKVATAGPGPSTSIGTTATTTATTTTTTTTTTERTRPLSTISASTIGVTRPRPTTVEPTKPSTTFWTKPSSAGPVSTTSFASSTSNASSSSSYSSTIAGFTTSTVSSSPASSSSSSSSSASASSNVGVTTPGVAVNGTSWSQHATTSKITTTSSDSETLEEIPQTTYSPGLVTWSSNSDVPATKAPEISTTIANQDEQTEWTPITTPDGWIMIQSPSTEKPLQTQEETTATASITTTRRIPTTKVPVAETIFQHLTTAKPVTDGTTPEDVTWKTTTISTSTMATLLSTIASVTIDTELPVPMETLNMSDYKQVCGRRLLPESRIVGGNPGSFGKWPWQISLRQWRTSTYLHKCGAALLNENWAITAAHCVENVPPSDLLLRIGEHDLANEDEPYGFQERRVQIVASHPQFDPRTFEYDLALLRFYEPLLPFQPNVLPICLPDDDETYVGRTAYVTGWGRLFDEGPLPSVLQEVAVPVINNTVCESMYRNAGYIEHIPNIFICAGWRNGGFDSCEGDSGGPMVIQRARDKRWILAGVISWGIGCAVPNQPGVYTRISEFREWINQILQF